MVARVGRERERNERSDGEEKKKKKKEENGFGSVFDNFSL